MTPRWMTRVLYAAAIYNVVWGAFVILFPADLLFEWAGMGPPRYPQLWQCIGMMVGVYGIGYWIAARDPVRWWPLVLIGLLGKILGPIGFARAVYVGALPLRAGWTIVTNDLVWWIPFLFILIHAYRSPRP